MMLTYFTQINKLAGYIREKHIKSLNVYDIDGTIAPYAKNKMSEYSDIVRIPVCPYILLSARASEHKWITRIWCNHHKQYPLAIFHREISFWSFEQHNIEAYKPAVLSMINAVLPEISLTVFDDEFITLRNCHNTDLVMCNRI